MAENTADTSILISLESIQQQIQHCENIVDNIDKLVPNLYKIRQQALAQKSYITDIQHTLSNNNKQYRSVDNSNDKIYARIEEASDEPGGLGQNKPTVLVVTAPATDVNDSSVHQPLGAPTQYKNKNGVAITKNIISNEQKLRDVIQSLYKFKHDQGTSVHFTTQQIDGTTNGDIRTKGLNLADVESITEGLNDYLSISDKDVAGDISNSVAEIKVKNTVLKLFAPVETANPITLNNSSIEGINGIDTSKLNELKAPFSSINGSEAKELTHNREVKHTHVDNESQQNISETIVSRNGRPIS